MRRIRMYIVSFAFVLLFSFSGCSDDDGDVKTMADLHVVIESGDSYKFVVTTGEDEDAAIVRHPAGSFVTSEFKKDSVTTNGIYTYQASPGFTGVEEVEIEKSYFTYDPVPQQHKAIIKIRITVEKSFPEKYSR